MVSDAELKRLIELGRQRREAMTPEEREAEHRAQARSFVIAEAGFGSDADEAAYRDALSRKDTETLARLDAKSAERMRVARQIVDERYPLPAPVPGGG